MKLRKKKRDEKVFDAWESEAWRPPPVQTIDEWLEANVILPRSVSAFPGPLNLGLTPYLREVLRSAVDPQTEEISLKWSTQMGKTLVMMGVGFYHSKNDPWPMLHVMPRDSDAWAINIERYQAVINESPVLKEMVEDARYAESREAIRLRGMTLHFTGANSPAGLASRSICKLFMDEVDKWPPWTGKEADPVKLARERTRWFYNRLIIKSSTPTTESGYISREFAASTQERYHVPCPHCGRFQILVFGGKEPGTPGIKWPAEVRDPHQIRDKKLAWYECVACHGRILDSHKPGMLRLGRWVPIASAIDDSGTIHHPGGVAPSRRHVGYHIWAAYSPLLSFSEVAAEFLNSCTRPETHMNFVNSWLAEEWREAVNELRDSEIRVQVSDYSPGTVPDRAVVLTVGVDVQRPANTLQFYYVVRGWAPGEESWLIRHGVSLGWNELERVIFGTVYKNSQNVLVPVQVALIDSGDGVNTLEVYDWCSVTGCTPSKGASKPIKNVWWSPVERAGGILQLCMINTSHYKQRLHRLARTEKWHLHREMEEDYFRQMTAEQLVQQVSKTTGHVTYVWQVMPPGTPNHYFDAEVLALVGADLLDVRFEVPERVEGAPVSARAHELVEPIRISSRVFTS